MIFSLFFFQVSFPFHVAASLYTTAELSPNPYREPQPLQRDDPPKQPLNNGRRKKTPKTKDTKNQKTER